MIITERFKDYLKVSAWNHIVCGFFYVCLTSAKHTTASASPSVIPNLGSQVNSLSSINIWMPWAKKQSHKGSKGASQLVRWFSESTLGHATN